MVLTKWIAKQTNSKVLHNENDVNSLGHNKTKGLAERKDGKIWIVHNDGIDCFDPQTEKFVHIYRMILKSADMPDMFLHWP